jgi:phage gpG-like protein
MVVRIRVNGVGGVVEQIRAKRERLEDMTPAWQAVGEDMRTFVDDRFRTQTDPGGAKWPAISEATAQMRLKRTKKGKRRFSSGRKGNVGKALSIAGDLASQKILSVTARLRNSVHYRATKKQMSMRASTVYAATHQFGRPDNKLPNAGGPFTFKNANGTPVTMTPRAAPIPERPYFPVKSPSRGRYEQWEGGPADRFWLGVRERLLKWILDGET